ncbi:MAG: hypothetical protein K0R31_1187 [Clostridiales bacterium]|jgi:dihydroorotase|nr:hypothetical protein [Clostridiales bacterium]
MQCTTWDSKIGLNIIYFPIQKLKNTFVSYMTQLFVMLGHGGRFMKYDLIIKAGWVIDAQQQIDGINDVAVIDGKISAVGENLGTDARNVINAAGCIVSAGLIDNHLHMFADATDAGIDSNVALLPSCVTTAVEGGSPGVANFEHYRRTIVNNSRVRMKCYMSASSTGMITRKFPENFKPDFMERDRIKALFQKYPDLLLGLKVRCSKSIVGDLGKKPLEEVIKLAEEIGCKVTVHITDPAIDPEEIAQMLRPGDVFCHAYQGTGMTIIGADGKVKPKVREAQQKGVIIDACNGAYNFSFEVARAAIADGFFPDIISTDYNTMVMYQHPVISLPYLMAKYLALGMQLKDVFKACTKAPADAIGLTDSIGTLKIGAAADIAVFKLVDHESFFYDCHGAVVKGDRLLVPQMTLKDGKIMYRQVTFNSELK